MNTTKVFVSAQIDEKDAARRAFAEFRAAGMTITHDWTTTDAIGDMRARCAEAGRRAQLDIDGVVGCDVYVLLSDNKCVGKGMYVELGAALALKATVRPELRVCVVGPMNHSSIFYLHPDVEHYGSVAELLTSLSRYGSLALVDIAG